MKCFSQKLLPGIVVIAALLFMFDQYAESIIGDCGKPGPNLKQCLLQDVGKINKEINSARAKLSKANEGDDLFRLTLTKTSMPNLRNQMNELSHKIAEALKSQRNNKSLIKLSNDMKKAMNILNRLGKNAKANRRSASQELLKKLSDAVRNLQNDINKLGPQPEPPDLDVERKMKYDRGVKEGIGVGSGRPVDPPPPTSGDSPPKPKDDPAMRSETVETEIAPGLSESSPAPDGPIVGPGDPETEVTK